MKTDIISAQQALLNDNDQLNALAEEFLRRAIVVRPHREDYTIYVTLDRETLAFAVQQLCDCKDLHQDYVSIYSAPICITTRNNVSDERSAALESTYHEIVERLHQSIAYDRMCHDQEAKL